MRQLECFVRVCELGSISRAAEQLNVAQPALGLQIRNLEHDFGVALLVRSSRGVAPTAAGEIVLAWAGDMIERTNEVRKRLRSAARPEDRVLSLGLTPSVTYVLAGTILEEASRRVPALSLRLVEALSHMVLEWVEGERVDLALVSVVPERRSLAQTPLLRERLYLVTADRGGGGGPIPLVDAFSAAPLAMPGENDALRRIVESEARKVDLPLTVTFEIASIAAIKDLVTRGVANAILPYGAVRREVRQGELAARPVIEPAISRTLHLVRRHDREVGNNERQLVRVIEDCLSSLADDDGLGVGAYELLQR